MKRGAGARASGCFQALKKNPHEMGLKKGNVKIGERCVVRNVLKNWFAALDDFRNWLIREAA